MNIGPDLNLAGIENRSEHRGGGVGPSPAQRGRGVILVAAGLDKVPVGSTARLDLALRGFPGRAWEPDERVPRNAD